MATPTIPNSEEYFFPIIYEGNGAGQRVGRFVPFTDNGTIANSVIYNRADSPKLARTPSSDGNRKTFTISVWYKPTDLGTRRVLFSADTSGSDYALFEINANNKAFFTHSSVGDVISTRTFEDTSKFYHFMLAVDTTQSTASDRVKIYVDGDLITSLDSSTYPSQDFQTNVNSTSYPMAVGSFNSLTTLCAGGYLAEFNFVDGQALTPASFGLTDTSTGRWIPKTVSPFPTTTTDIAVTVVDSGGNKYALDGVTQGTVTLIEGATYKFDQSDSSNSGHPLRFSTTSDGTHGGGSEFTSGVTTAGTPGSSGAYTEITVPTGTATLYYYCSVHSGMGGTANTQDQYGTNGFRLKFQDSSALGDDTSGNGNDFSATNLASTDQTTDSPTQNHNNMGGSKNGGTSVAEGNLETTTPSGGTGYLQIVGLPAFGVNKGKWYWEVKITTVGTGLYGWKDDGNAGGSQASNSGTIGSGGNFAGALSAGSSGSYSAGSWFIDHDYNNEVNYTTVATNDVLMFALDLDNNKGYCGKNGTWFNSADPANGTGAIGGTQRANGVNKFYPMCARLGGSASTGEWNFGQRSFAYTAPTGFSALQQDNLPETAKGISGLVWTKNRDAADNHQLYDSSRGKQLVLASNTDGIESTVTDGLQRFLAGGQQIEGNDAINTAGESFVSWNWVANGGTTASNTDGSITSTVQANTTAGFSIVKYVGTGANATVGHGLSSAPEWVMTRIRNAGSVAGFAVGCTADPSGFNNFLYLNETTASTASAATWNNTAPTNSVFSVGTSEIGNYNGYNMLAYCWHSVDGFSKIGKYVGNSNADGVFVYTGFKPSFVLIKSTSIQYWMIQDSARWKFNPTDKPIFPSNPDAESSLGAQNIDLLSNGFKCRGTSATQNSSSHTYIYMAFAEHPFVGDGTSPVTAR